MTPTVSEFSSLSLVIPAYNEAQRIAATLSTAVTYLIAQPYPAEIILIDDGSSDDTLLVAEAAAAPHPMVRVLAIPHRGKAAAVRVGMRAAVNDVVAFSDADLATPLSYLEGMRDMLSTRCDIVIGSREGAAASRVGEPSYRHLMGRIFNLLVRALLLPGIQDTQCGFKVFRRPVLKDVLDRALLYPDSSQPVHGPRVTAFDVELLVIARRLGFTICSVPVVWTYGTSSKVHPGWDTWHNVIDVLRVRINASRGRYG